MYIYIYIYIYKCACVCVVSGPQSVMPPNVIGFARKALTPTTRDVHHNPRVLFMASGREGEGGRREVLPGTMMQLVLRTPPP